MKKIEFIEKDIQDKFLILHYWKGEKDMSLLLNIPDTIDLLYKSNLIDDYNEADTIQDTVVMIDEIIDPLGPNEEEKAYQFNPFLDEFLKDLPDSTYQQIIEHYEGVNEAEGIIVEIAEGGINDIVNNLKALTQPVNGLEAWSEGAKKAI